MKVLFVGLGNLGGQVFDLFALRAKADDHILVAGRNEAYLRERTQWTVAAALQLGTSLKIDVAAMDIFNIDQVAHIISAFSPDVIYSSVSLLPSSRISQLALPLFQALAEAQGGPWLPTTLAPVHKLMQAVKQTRMTIPVLNGGTPDTSHEILGKVGLAPTSGFGNIGLIIPPLRKAIAAQLHKPVKQIEVFFFAHAYVIQHLRTGTSGGAPFYGRVYVEEEDITAQIDFPMIFTTLPATLEHEYTQLLTAATAVSILDVLITSSPSIVHVPGPVGLPGGYPVQRGTQIPLEVKLPDGLSLEEAIRINRGGQQLDGIERVDDDGTVHFMEKNMSILKSVLGYECRKMRISEAEARAIELKERYLRLLQ